MNEPRGTFDEQYWGPGGIDLTRWGYACQRGAQYVNLGPVVDGQAGAVRKISQGRKARRMASDDFKAVPK